MKIGVNNKKIKNKFKKIKHNKIIKMKNNKCQDRTHSNQSNFIMRILTKENVIIIDVII